MAGDKTAVNVPMDQKQKEKDVNNKLQLFGIYQGTLRNYKCMRTTNHTCSFRQWQSAVQQADRCCSQLDARIKGP
jgi:hypothetical protein